MWRSGMARLERVVAWMILSPGAPTSIICLGGDHFAVTFVTAGWDGTGLQQKGSQVQVPVGM